MSQAFPGFTPFASVTLDGLDNETIMDKMMDHASSGKHNNVLKWMIDNGCNITLPAMTFIEHSNDTEIMACIDWNVEYGLPDAAYFGHINCVKYAASVGIAFDEMMCSAAATGGQLEMLKYLRENGCPWNSQLYPSCMDRLEDLDSQDVFPCWEEMDNICACMEYARLNGLEAAAA